MEEKDEEKKVNKKNPKTKKESGRRVARIDKSKNKKKDTENDNNNKNKKKDGTPKKKMPRKKKIIIALSIILGIFLLLGIVFGVYLFKAKGNVKEAVLNIATDIVGEQDPIFVLILGVSEDISAKLTDTIILCGYNPSTQKAFMLSVPRDTFVGKNPASANGYDKINAQFQKSAEKTVESVELLTGVTIDHYVIVRNISIESIFDCFGSIDFDVPINMDYDDPTQDLHIHLKKGYQTLQPNQIEQLLRFRHNNDGTSYPSSYGDNDYGRMRTQREFIKAAMGQIISVQNVGKLKDLASMVYTNLQTNMSGYKVLDYVPHALKFDTSKLRSEQLPGQSAMINDLWFYQASKSKTKTLVDELMIYLELDDKTLDSHYKYASEIKGIKPDENWVSEEVIIDDDYGTTSSKKDDEVVDQETCEHDFKVYDDSDKPGCEKAGTIVYKCLICGKEKQEQVKPLGHEYKDGKCIRCQKEDPNYVKEEVESDSNKPCQHTYVEKERKEPTCTEAGYVKKECSKCHDVQTESLKAKGHSYTKEISREDSTCSKKGTITLQCERCTATTTKEIEMKEHTYVNNPNQEKCTVCGNPNPNYKPPQPTPPIEGEDESGNGEGQENPPVSGGGDPGTPSTQGV